MGGTLFTNIFMPISKWNKNLLFQYFLKKVFHGIVIFCFLIVLSINKTSTFISF